MRKRILSLMLVLVFCFSLVPSIGVNAAENVGQAVPTYSVWAFDDLLVGDSYGIYPMRWYEKGLTIPIRNAQLRVLVAGLRNKILNTNNATDKQQYKLTIHNKMTVEEVVNTLYAVISSYDYNVDLGLKKKYSPVAYMQEYGLYSETGGELKLKDICSVEQACAIATRMVTFIYDALDAGSKGFLWQTKSGDNTVYMLGSIHIATNDIYPFNEKMLNAYRSADALVVEVNLYDTLGATIYSQLAVYSDGTMLKDHISAECYKKMLDLAISLGYTEEQMEYLKPWYLYTLFSTLATSGSGDFAEVEEAASLGIDYNFMTNAMVSQKPILEIEGYEKQTLMLDNFSAGLQEYLLNGSIDSLNAAIFGTADENTSGAEVLSQWLEYWNDGNVEAFNESFDVNEEILGDTFEESLDEETKAYMEEYYDALLTQRDKGMADYIDKLLKAEGSNTYFVVVGSLHYLSDYSVLDILKEKKYEITQIK